MSTKRTADELTGGNTTAAAAAAGPIHSHNSNEIGGGFYHSHSDNEPAHYHPSAAGNYADRDAFKCRDYSDRAFTIGVGGPVGSGKTHLILSLCKYLRDKYSICVVTNDIFTAEDCEFLTINNALGIGNNNRIRALETGGCPHAAVRDDCSGNLHHLYQLTAEFNPDFCFVESGGDNLSAAFSRELADYTIYVIDVAGGDKIPRKGGPGITQSDLLVINKTDLATAVGADLILMEQQAKSMRTIADSVDSDAAIDSTATIDTIGPVILAQVKHMIGIDLIATEILQSWNKIKSLNQLTAAIAIDNNPSATTIGLSVYDDSNENTKKSKSTE